jgi:DNA adenine methylase
MAERIIGMMPAHKIYCEPFFGGGAVFFRKPKAGLEVINDCNDRLITFYHEVQTNFEAVYKLVQQTLHSETLYRRAKDVYNRRVPADDTEMAWAVWMITNISFSGSMQGGWKWCNGSSGSHSGIFMRNKRDEFCSLLRDRMEDVQISSRDALDVIRQRDTKDTFFYLDPPYPGHTQQHYHGYTMRDLCDLLDVLTTIKGRFILSNFWSQTLRYYVLKNSWTVKKIKMPMKVANFTTSRNKTEILISNYNNAPSLFDGGNN